MDDISILYDIAMDDDEKDDGTDDDDGTDVGA